MHRTYLKTHTFQSQNLLVWVHKRRVGSNRSTHDIVGVGEVDNNDLVLVILFLSYTDIVVGLECQGLKHTAHVNTSSTRV